MVSAAGETDWHGSQSDLNIIDAVLLTATRIGHGYSITKHPQVLRLARERDIPIEVCPISNQVQAAFAYKNSIIVRIFHLAIFFFTNAFIFFFPLHQVLGLVNDLRNHPASHLVLEGFPMIVASDDVASWGAQGLSDDFYEVLMAMSSKTSDLRMLKKLVLNSLKYSALSDERKLKCQAIVGRKWNSFVKAFRQN